MNEYSGTHLDSTNFLYNIILNLILLLFIDRQPQPAVIDFHPCAEMASPLPAKRQLRVSSFLKFRFIKNFSEKRRRSRPRVKQASPSHPIRKNPNGFFWGRK